MIGQYRDRSVMFVLQRKLSRIIIDTSVPAVYQQKIVLAIDFTLLRLS